MGGAERVILKQVELFQKKGFNAECYFAYIDKNLHKETSNPHCYTKTFFNKLVPNNSAIRIITSIPLAPLALPTFNKENLLICHGYGPAPIIGYLNKKLRKTKYVTYIHSPPRFLYLNPEERSLWKFNDIRKIIFRLSKIAGPVLKELDYLGVTNSDIVLANSYFTAKRIQTIYQIHAKVCYPPVDIKSFRILDRKIVEKVRNRFSCPIILSTGRIVAVKRWEWLLEIMSLTVKEIPSATLAITGEISEENFQYVEKLRKMSKKLKIERNVKFLGFKSQKELIELYNAADVYVYPVPKEDFGLGPVEAMACGTPSVVWDDGGGPCETVFEGKTGFRAKPYDRKDFAEKILKILEMDKSEFSCKTRNFVKENFSCTKHWKTLREIIERVG